MADSVKIKITADDSDYRSKMDGLEDIAKKGTGKVAAIAGAIGGAVSAVVSSAISGLQELVGEAVSASDALTKFDNTMSFAGFGAKEIKEAKAAVKDYADKTVFELNDVSNTTAQLAANGVDNYEQLTEAAGNLTAVAGGGADQFKAVAMVLTQTAGAGKLTTENWNQLTDAIPGASGKLQEAMLKNGAYTGNFRDAMEKGEITADEFNQAMMDLGMSDVAKEAATSTATFEGAFGNLKANVISGIDGIIDKIGKGKITGAITKISDAVVSAFDVITKVIGFIVDHINIFGPLAIALGAVTAATWLWNAALNANPISIIIIGIAALVAGILWLWDNCEGFRDVVLGIWDAIKEAWDAVLPYFQALWAGIKAIWDTISPYLSAAWEVIKTIFFTYIGFIVSAFQTAWTVIKAVWDFVQPYFQALWDGIVAVFSVVVDVLGGFFSAAWDAIKVIWDVVGPYFQMLWEVIKGIFSVVKAVLSGDFSGAWDAIKGIWNAVTGYFSDIWSGIKSVFANIKEWFGEKFETAYNAIKDWFTLDNFKSVFKDSIVGGLNGILEDVKTAASSIWTAIKEALSQPIKVVLNFLGIGDGGDYGADSGGALSPFGARISSGFGVQRPGHKHGGVDFAAPTGTPIQATTAGRVIRSTYQAGGFGNYVVVQDIKGNTHYYGHMSRKIAYVGELVGRGSLLGYVGSTGHSTGPHLHYEVRQNGKAVNPYQWYASARGYATGGYPLPGELFFANENGIELMGKMGSKNVVANNMQIIEGIKAGVASGAVQAARIRANAGSTDNRKTEINVQNQFYKEQIAPSEIKRATRRGIKQGLAGGTV